MALLIEPKNHFVPCNRHILSFRSAYSGSSDPVKSSPADSSLSELKIASLLPADMIDTIIECVPIVPVLS